MHTTGNAGGSHNLRMFDNNSHAGNNLNEMFKLMETGFCYRINGSGVNIITGDYSRGVSGFWIQNGQISFPVYEITIAGNLKEMFQNIVSIGTDEYRRGSKTTGSVLIETMTIGGS